MRSLLSFGVLLVGLSAAPPAVSAKPPSAPVRLEFTVPAEVKTGDVVTTVLTLRALADLDRLEVDVAPFFGLDVLSEPRQAVFTSVRRGEGREFTVTIRLTDPKLGSLTVRYRTLRGKAKAADSRHVDYGTAGN